MHLIITDKNDQPTNDVLRWFNYYGHKSKVILVEDTIKANFSLSLENPILSFRDERYTLNLNQIQSLWFRRGRLKLNYNYLSQDDNKIMRSFHHKTKFTIEHYLNFLAFKKVRCLGNPFRLDVNKLEVLQLANSIGLKTPKSILSDSPQEVKKYFKNSKAITKLLVAMNNYTTNDEKINYLTMDFNEEFFTSDDFSLSLFQEKIEKRYEIRVFYLNGRTYSKAIYSQKDSMTKNDYRNYNLENPNRETPFKLTKEIDQKVHVLMTKLELNTGSIDFIVNLNNEFIFLEVNPIGQFSDLSYNSNYNLEKIIVKYLTNNE